MFPSDGFNSFVTRGIDPWAHLFRKKMDCTTMAGGIGPQLN
jgi:hypothetical protein